MTRTRSALILLLALPTLGPAATPTGIPQESRPTEDASARPLRRVLHLSGGGTVRALSRQQEGAWEWRSGATWKVLPPGAVLRAELERDLLAEAGRRERVAGGDPGARLELCAWMLDEGLAAEAVGILDRLLEDDPYAPGAITLLGRRRLFPVPSADEGEPAAARAALVSWAVGASPSMREAALGELARADRDALHPELRAALASRTVARRAFAAQALGRLLPGEEVKNLILLAALDPSEDVRRHASLALRATGEPGVAAPLVRALASPSPRLRVQAAEALGHMGFAATVEPLMMSLSALSSQRGASARRTPHSYVFVGRQFAYVQDFDVEVAQFQAVADPQVNVLLEGAVLEAGVHSVTEYSFAYESQVIRRSLVRLTGEDPGPTARAWLGWWDANREEWLARTGADAVQR